MDTSSHIIIGIGLGTLAHIDPIVAGDASLAQAVVIGTVIGSIGPDFDFIYKLKGNGSYCRNHRGWSHSLPLLPSWGLVISCAIAPFFPDTSFLHLFFWTFLAVILHIILDLFNVFGTQALRPFSSRWLAFDTLPLFDPYILILHAAGFSMLPFFEAGRVFSIIYILMFLYIFLRAVYSGITKRYLQKHFLNAIRLKLIPRVSLLKWNVFIETEDDFLFGEYSLNSLCIEHTLPKNKQYPELIIDSKKNTTIANFLASTNYAYPFVVERKNGFFIYWRDLRFRSNKFFPYFAVMFISSDCKYRSSYIGWFYSLKQYKKILRNLKNNATCVQPQPEV